MIYDARIVAHLHQKEIILNKNSFLFLEFLLIISKTPIVLLRDNLSFFKNFISRFFYTAAYQKWKRVLFPLPSSHWDLLTPWTYRIWHHCQTHVAPLELGERFGRERNHRRDPTPLVRYVTVIFGGRDSVVCAEFFPQLSSRFDTIYVHTWSRVYYTAT